MTRFEVVELRTKVRATGFGVQDNEKGWVCAMFMFAEVGVANAERAARTYADKHNGAASSRAAS